MKKNLFPAIIVLATIAFSTNARAEAAKAEPAKPAAKAVAAPENYVLTIKDHKFSPQELELPADKKVKVVVKNLDASPAEFESEELNREKIVGANSEITVNLGPLKAGTYGFFDDFNRTTTTGTIKVK